MKKSILTSIILLFATITFGQSIVVKGQLIDFKTNKPMTNQPIILFGTTQGVKSDSEGRFEIKQSKFTNIELIIIGGQFIGQTQDNSINYYTVCLRNINLNIQSKTIDLGIIYMITNNDLDQFSKIPCKVFVEKKIKYLLVDGADRYINGKYVLIDFSSISNDCIN